MSAVLLAAVCISLANVLSPLVYQSGTNVYALLVLRLVVFLCVAGLWIRLRSDNISLGLTDRLSCYAAGLAYSIGAGALLGAFAYLPVSFAILIFYTFPFIILILESLLERRLPAPRRLACVAVAFVGVALALRADVEDLQPIGLVLAATAATGVALAFTWTGRRLKHIDPLTMTFHMSVSGLVLFTVMTATIGSFSVGLQTTSAVLLLTAAVMCFSIAFLAMFEGVRLLGASQSGMFMNLEPVLTILLAFVVLRESLSPIQLLGTLLVVAAVLTAQQLSPAQTQ